MTFLQCRMERIMSKVQYKQGDIIYLDFSPAIDTEMEGIHVYSVFSERNFW